MSLPNDTLSSIAHYAPFAYAMRGPRDYTIDYELAGYALYDGTQGMLVRTWHARVYNKKTVQISADGVVWQTMFTRTNPITEVALAFDANMYPFVAFMEDTDSDNEGDAGYYWWLDNTDSTQKFTALPTGAVSPRCCIDDHRSSQGSVSDIVLTYIVSGVLYCRYQRDRYDTEYTLASGLGSSARVVCVGMNTYWRLQWRIAGATTISNATSQALPYLNDIVISELSNVGISADNIDATQLATTEVTGFRVTSQGTPADVLEALQQCFMFDPGEWDKKIHFVMRGGDPVASLTYDDLLQNEDSDSGENSPMTVTRTDESELPRKTTVQGYDSSIGCVTNTQFAERRVSTINAQSETSFEIEVVGDSDFIAGVALKQLMIPWGERNSFAFGLTQRWAALTPTDVVTYTDANSRVYRFRLGQLEEDYGSYDIAATADAKWLYSLTASGTSTTVVGSTTPGEVGNTVAAMLDIPVLYDEDDELGFYAACYGTGSGWAGGVVYISLDGGSTTYSTLTFDVGSNMGTSTTALLAETSPQYLDNQTLTVNLLEAPESVEREAILRYSNLAAIQHSDGTWEILQYETVVDNGDDTYTLSGLVRGRYNTSVGECSVGATFVLLDSFVKFVQIQKWMIGETISYKGVPYNGDADDYDWTSIEIPSRPASQTEWEPHYVRATRDGSNNVTVSWIGRARLGVETSPTHSQYFTGYRVTFSDGTSFDTTDMTYTYNSAPAGLTISVAGVNSITGVGPSSNEVSI